MSSIRNDYKYVKWRRKFAESITKKIYLFDAKLAFNNDNIND